MVTLRNPDLTLTCKTSILTNRQDKSRKGRRIARWMVIE